MSEMKIRGFAIAGLSMNSGELVLSDAIVKLQNPEVADAQRIDAEKYSLEDIAVIHLQKIKALVPSLQDSSAIFYGMSMGGMVLSILASKYRSELPKDSKFVFLVTSPNSKQNPAVPDELMARWFKVMPGDVDGFRSILHPFFSNVFRKLSPQLVENYIQYRAQGANLQAPRDFLRQLMALRNFNGQDYFAHVNPREATVISGAKDDILGPKHHQELLSLMPGVNESLIPDLGHMVNIERPKLFEVSPLSP